MPKRKKWKLVNVSPGDLVEFQDKHMISPETAKVKKIGKHMALLVLAQEKEKVIHRKWIRKRVSELQ